MTLVLAEHRGPVLVLTLNRPDRLNAWNDDLENAYFALLDEAEDDPGVRAIVVTGAGRGFCAGADMSDLEEASTTGDLLPRLIGPSRALDLLLSGRVVEGHEARDLGLVDFVAEPVLDAAVEYATELAAHCSPASMRVIKEQVHQDLDRTFEAAVAVADRLMLDSFRRPDAAEGVKSHLEGRPPAFRPLDPR